MLDGTKYALDVLKKPSERDKQTLVGASNISQPCDRCLVDDLLAVPKKPSGYWLGARIGTAIHQALEEGAPDFAQSELRVTLGTIPGYGTVQSTTDLYLPNDRAVWDIKSTTRDKLKKYRGVLEHGKEPDEATTYKLVSYITQIQLYGFGLAQEGKPVETVGIIFVCRDGQGDNDVWAWYTDYVEDDAVDAMERVGRLWQELENGANPNNYEWHYGCYYCNRVR